MGKYKILHIVDSFGLGGAQEVIMNLLKFRDKTTFHCEVAALHGIGPYFEKIKKLEVPTYSLSPNKFLPLYIPNLIRLMKGGKFDVCHCHLIASNIIAKPLAALSGVPVRINHDHCNDQYRYKERLRLFADKITNKFSTHIIAVCSSTKDFLIKHEHIAPEKINIVINGVDAERFYPQPEKRQNALEKWNLPDSKIIIAGVGRLRYQKNFHLFLKVAAQVLKQTKNVHFVIAGDGPDEHDLKQLARKLHISHHVSFLGFVDDVTTLYPGVDVFLLTSRFEGTPMTVLEAMACKIPIVAPAIDGIAEMLEDNNTAFLFPHSNNGQIVTKLLTLIQNPQLAKDVAENAWKKVQSQYSATSMTKQVESIYLRYLS